MARERIIRDLVCERFIVNLKSGESFDGVLTQADNRTLVFADASAHTGDGQRIEMDGLLYLDRADVAYLQRPEGRP